QLLVLAQLLQNLITCQLGHVLVAFRRSGRRVRAGLNSTLGSPLRPRASASRRDQRGGHDAADEALDLLDPPREGELLQAQGQVDLPEARERDRDLQE